MDDLSKLGPLAALVGTWEGDEGLDVSFNYAAGKVTENPYREHTTFQAFGPVDSGDQALYGLDYRNEAFRIGETEGFHMEVGYWLWDGDANQVMRCFMVPRGCTILAGGTATADATQFKLSAELGSTTYGILSNKYLDANAKAVRYDLTIDLSGGQFAYEEDLVLDVKALGDQMHHTDRNKLSKV